MTASALLSQSRNGNLYLGLAWGLFALVLLVATNGNIEFHFDEIITYRVIQEGWSEIASERLRSTHSPFYFWLVKPLYWISDDPHVLRYPSALFSAIGLAVMVIAIGKVVSKRAANIYALGLITCPGWIYLAHFARPYALLVMLVMLGMASLVLILAPRLYPGPNPEIRPRSSIWTRILLSASTALAPAILMSGTLYVVALTVMPFFNRVLRQDREFIASWWRAMLPGIVSAGLFLWLLSTAIIRKSDTYWVQKQKPLTVDSVMRVITNTFSSADATWLGYSHIVGSAIALIGVALVLVAFALRSRHKALFWASLPLGILLPLLYVVVSFRTSLMVDRYFYLTAPGLFGLIAISADTLWQKRVGTLALLALLAFMVLQAACVQFWPRQQMIWRATMERVMETGKPPEALVIYPPNRVHTVRVMLDYELSVKDRIEVVPGTGNEADLDRLISGMLDRHPSVWIIEEKQGRYARNILTRRSDLTACRLDYRTRPVYVIRYNNDGGTFPERCLPV